MKFAAYSLTAQIGKSPLSATYRASPVALPEHEVVIKIFHASCLGPGYEARDFRRDAARLQSLTHPHLLAVLDADIEQQQPFVVTPYLPAGSLRERLRTLSPPRLPVARALRLGVQIGEALDYCHANNIVHGHLTPDNVLFTDDETVQLADSGLASLIDESVSHDPPSPQAGLYQAPEQLMQLVSYKSDQYALGCLLYELLTGTLPAASPEPPPAPSRLVPEVPEALDVVLLKALAREPVDRYESVAELVAALHAISVAGTGNRTETGATRSQARPRAVPPRTASTRPDSLPQGRPAFPFGSESSARYRHALSSLELEEIDGPAKPQVAQKRQEEPEARKKLGSETVPIKPRETEAVPVKPRETEVVPLLAHDTLVEPALPSPASVATQSPSASAPWPRIWRPFLLVLTLALILFLVVMGFLATYYFAPGNSLTGKEAATAKVVTATATARQLVYTQAIGGAPTFDDPLTAEDGNAWATGSVGSISGDGCYFADGAYRARVSLTGNNVLQCMLRDREFVNFALQMEVSVTAGDSGGLVFRSNPNAEYRFNINPDGTYDLSGAESANILTSKAPTPAHIGFNRWNVLTIVAKDSDLYLYVNGQFVIYCHDSTSSSGNIGTFAVNHGGLTNVLFRNAKVWQL